MKHLTVEERYVISMMKEEGKSQREIAPKIGKSESTVCRELARNCDKRSGKYHYQLAQQKYRKRIKEKPKHIRFTPEIKHFVESKIKDDFSPEQIVGVAKKEGIPCVSHERIYQHLWSDKKQGGTLYTHLRTRGKRYRKRGNKKDRRGIIPHRIDISQRPAIVDEKSRVGDFEIDTVIGKNHQGALLTINERKTGLVKIIKVPAKESALVADAAIAALMPYKGILHTITVDNGKEFARHFKISQQLNIDFYFAKPYHAWERGANENLNGLIRQYFPKKTDFRKITEKEVQRVENILNNRPRKRLNFVSPNEIFNQFINQTKIAFVT